MEDLLLEKAITSGSLHGILNLEAHKERQL